MVGELKGRAGKPWTDYEVSILKAMAGDYRTIIIARRLGRSTAAIRAHAAALGLSLMDMSDD
jgi:DNA-binding NarL/FixJ family response regulator